MPIIHVERYLNKRNIKDFLVCLAVEESIIPMLGFKTVALFGSLGVVILLGKTILFVHMDLSYRHGFSTLILLGKATLLLK